MTKSTQEIMNDLYGVQNKSVQDILNDVYSGSGNNTIISVGAGLKYTTLSVAIAAAVAGYDIDVKPGTYTETVTVPTGINLIGSGSNCVLNGNLILQGTANARGILIADGYYVEQNGVRYYG